jgi:hypothetical protein
MNPYRVLVTASRTWLADTRSVEGLTIDDALDSACFTAAGLGFPGLVVVHGACPKGGDAVADRWGRDRARRGWPVAEPERHPADWGRGKRAGFDRNDHMVSLCADQCFAFVDVCRKPECRRSDLHGSHGAVHCATAAVRAGIPVTWFTTTADLPAPAGVDTPSPTTT